MWRYAARRILILVPTMVAVTLGIFVLMRTAVKGDPALYLMGHEATLQQAAAAHARLGLDRPILVQYVAWLRRLGALDLGRSFEYPIDVRSALAGRLPATAELAGLATLFALAVAIPAGMFITVARETLAGRAVRAVLVAGICVPNFWLGMLLIYLFSVRLHWLADSAYTPFAENPGRNLISMILPAVSLAAFYGAAWARYLSSALLDVLHGDYIRVARAKGLVERTVLFKHALRNALIPVVTIVGQNIPYMLAGAVIVEVVFSLPGVGRLFSDAIQSRDYPVVQGAVLLVTAAVVLSSLVVDLTYGVLDPRIKYD
ncbi:MAG TPA: ABC transporter permease [bacterium]|nr:ABC transporter permease [bacterium]